MFLCNTYIAVFYCTLFSSLMEAGTNDNTRRFILHLLPDGKVSYSGQSGCLVLEIFFLSCFITACLYRLCRDSYFLLPMNVIAILCMLGSLLFSCAVKLPNHAVIPYLSIYLFTYVCMYVCIYIFII